MRHLNDLQVILDKRAYDKEIQSAQNIMENGAWYEKLIMNIISVPENVIGGSVAGITDILDIIKDGKLDNPYTVGHVWQDSASTVRSETAKSIDEEIDNEFLSAVATNTYQAVMSGADSAFGVAIMGKGYTLSASLSTFASRAKELYEMGATDAQVIVGAALDGVAEAFFEHFSIENLDAIKKAKLTGGIKGILKNALKQGGIEASEEFFTQIANQVSDSIVMAASSKNEQAIQQYIAQGMTRDEAEQQAAFDAFKEQLWAAYGGFVSGGMSAGGISIVNNAINKVTQNQAYAEIGQKIIDANAVNGFVATAIDLGKGTKSYNYANKFQSRDAKSAVKVGKLYDYTMTDLAEQSVNEMIDAQTVNSSNLIAIVTDRYMKTAFETRTGISLQGDTATQLNTARQAIESGEYKNSADNITENAENLPESSSNSTVNDTANTDVISEQEAEIDDYNGISVPDTTPVEENEFDEIIRRMDGREAPLSEGQQYIRSVGKALGLTNVEFIDTTKGGITKAGNKFVATDDGFIDNDGTVYINSKASGSAALKVIFTHEISHFAEKNPEQYKKYAEAVFNSKTFEKWILSKANGRSHSVRVGKYRQSIIDRYAKHGVSLGNTKADAEIIAEFTSEMLFNEKNDTLERLAGEVNQKDRNAVFQFIHDFISWLKAVLKGEKISFDIVKLENHFASVLRNVETKSGQNKNTANDGGVEYTFAGENAATADKSLLAEAKKRTENGEDSETVRKETGWFKGYDGKWRFEINDSKMHLTDKPIRMFGTKLGELIIHDELFSAYPQLRNVDVRAYDSDTAGGSADFDGNTIWINNDRLIDIRSEKERSLIFETKEYKEYSNNLSSLIDEKKKATKPIFDKMFEAASNNDWETASKLNKEYKKVSEQYNAEIDRLEEQWASSEKGKLAAQLSDKSNYLGMQLSDYAKRTLIHEIQHFVQHYESLANGSSPEWWARKIVDDAYREKKRLKDEIFEKADYVTLDVLYMYDEYIDRLSYKGNISETEFAKAYDRAAKEISDENIEELFFDYAEANEKYYLLKENIATESHIAYTNTAGEIEARDVSNRLDYSSEQRKNTRPDIDRTDVVFADGEYVSYLSAENNNTSSIKEQLKAHLSEINAMKPVANIEVSNIKGKNNEQKRKYLVKEFQKYGFKIDRNNFGIITFEEKQINQSLNYLTSDAEYASFFAVPQVLKKGMEIYQHYQHKGRGYDTVTFAAPVTINGITGNMAVVVKKTKGNRYKTHRILMPDGSAFLYQDIKRAEATPDSMTVETTNSEGLPITSAPDTTVPQKAQSVNNYSMQNSENDTSENTQGYSFSDNESTDVQRDNGGIAVAERNQTDTANLDYSEVDADGAEMTKVQSDYFSKSKARDKNGSLYVVYHGTESEDFYEFDRARQGQTDYGSWGKGFYFDRVKSTAEMYGPNVRAFYLNITNPYRFSSFMEGSGRIARYLIKNGYEIDFDYKQTDAFEFVEKFGSDRFTEAMQNLGHDGVIIGDTEFVTFDENQAKLTSNQNPTENNDIRYSFGEDTQSDYGFDKAGNNKITAGMTDSERAEILKVSTIQLAEYDGTNEALNEKSVLALKSSYNSQAGKILKVLAEKFGVFKKTYKNDRISLDFNYSGNSLNESVHKQGDISTNFYDFAKMLYIFDDVIKNAVPIEVHTDKYKGTARENVNLKYDYVLLSAFKDGEYIIPVEMHVKEFNENYTKDNKLYVSITLGKIKIEDKVKVQSSGQKAQLSNTHLSSNISLPELVSKINPNYGNFFKYLPEALLNKKQNESRSVAIDDENYRLKVMRGEDVTNILETKAEEKGYSKDDDWKMDHRAPNANDGYSKSIDNIDAVYGSDGSIYSPKAVYYYGEGRAYDGKAIAVIKSAKDNPEKLIKIYRAVPTSIKDTRIRNGDWVAIVKEYAEEHGGRILDDDYRIIENTVPAKFLYGNGDSINEWGYDNGNENEVYKNTANNVKTIEVTYDDSGKIIPLSERFNEDNNDIRYSFEDDVVDKTSSLAERVRLGEISQTEYLNELQRLMNEATEKYGAIPKGENPAVDVRVPKRVSNDKNTRRHVRTILESGVLTDEMTAETDKAILQDALSYVPVSDKGAMRRADKALQNGSALKRWEAVVNGEGKISKDAVACGEALLRMEANAGHTARVMELIAQLSEVGTRLGQATQALSLLKKMSGIGQLYYIQKTVDRLNQDIDKRFNGTKDPVDIDETLAEQLAKAKPGEEAEAIADEILEDIAEQVPTSFLDKWNAWRYLAMLGNPRTHIRNIVGNAIFVPAVKVKNTIKTGLEQLLPQEQRTTSVAVKKEYKDYARDDFENVVDILTNGGKMNPSDVIRDNQKIFTSKAFGWLEVLRKFNFDMLEKEDLLFLKYHYVSALGGYLQARGIDINNISDTVLNEARNYAMEEAAKATYRDMSKLANVISRASHSNAVANIAIEGVLPFKKTPINIVKRGIEYSPIGLIKALTKGTYDLKKGDITASQYIDGISSGLTGAGIFVLGAILSKLGFVIGGLGYDDEDALKRLEGHQEYSIEIGGYSYTLDWAAPACIPFFMGTEFMNMFDDDEKGFAAAAIDAAYGSLEPIINLSMLSGIRDTIAAAKYADDADVLSAIGGEVLSSYAGQALPTLGGQIARTFDDTRRSNYVSSDATGFEKTALTFLQQSMGKIPFVEQMKQEYTDAFGNVEVTDNFFVRLLENMVSPGYSSTITEDNVIKELQELYNYTGDTTIIPEKAPKSFTVNGERVYLDADEYTKFNKLQGEKSKELIIDLMNSQSYKAMTWEKKAAAIGEAYSYALALAKTEVSDYELKESKHIKWKQYEDSGLDIAELIALQIADKDSDGSGSVSKDEYAEAVKNSYLSDNEKELLIGLNEASGYNDYVAKKTGAWAVGKWYKKVSGKYVEITDSNEFFEMRKNGTTTYQYTGKKTDEIDELWKAYRGY